MPPYRSSRCHDNNALKTIADRYVVGELIGRGSSGAIYAGVDSNTGNEVAVKIVSAHERSTLITEAGFYRHHGGRDGIPRLYWWGRPLPRTWVMIVDRLGVSMADVKRSCFRSAPLPLSVGICVALQMLARVEYVHGCGVIHRDLKPDNFMLGRGTGSNLVYLIDFGLSRSYLDAADTPRHVPMKRGVRFSGTPDFASLNTHSSCSPSRRDDIESLCYIIIFFLRGSLPWQNMSASSAEILFAQVAEKKRTSSASLLCRGLPPQILDLLLYARGLSFEEKPDYESLEIEENMPLNAHTQHIRDLLRSTLPPDFDFKQPLSQMLSKAPSHL